MLKTKPLYVPVHFSVHLNKIIRLDIKTVWFGKTDWLCSSDSTHHIQLWEMKDKHWSVLWHSRETLLC